MVSCKESSRFRPDRGNQIRIKNYLCLYETKPNIRTSSPGSTDTHYRLGDYVRFSVLLCRARKRKHQLDGILTPFCRTVVFHDRVLRQLLLLVPRYLFQSQTKRYITYNILLLCVIGLMLHLWRSLTFDPSFVPKPHRVGWSSGMAVLCQRYAESRLHHWTECRHTYECPMDTSGSCP